ncbi:MAG: aminoacyl-tRNA hydrolase [Nitrospirae bacterium]|nr:aminoacyl-tRNA hydrolase [Nitrospirota bacterium]
MWIIAGLGNPGKRYEKTRHNVGFEVVDRLSEDYGIVLKERDEYLLGKGAIEGQESLLVKPLTFMNRSGSAIVKVLRKFNSSAESLIIVHDDLDLGVGVIKIRKTGSSGGHKGVESIIQGTGTRDFFRVKFGVGRDPDIPSDVYVLSKFSPAEKSVMKDAIIMGSEAIACIITMGIDKAMTRYNRAAKTEPMPGDQ